MKNPYARKYRREFVRFCLRVLLVELPRLRWQMFWAIRRREPIEPLMIEANQIGVELEKKTRHYLGTRRADKMLSRAGWH